MKFKLALTLAIAILLSVGVSSNHMKVIAKSKSSNTTAASNNKVALEKRTSNYISQFIKGNFDDFYKDSTGQLQKKITKSTLKQGWDRIIAITGKPGESISHTYIQQNGLSSVSETIEGTLYNIIVTISYNSGGKPVGIWTNFVPKAPQATKYRQMGRIFDNCRRKEITWYAYPAKRCAEASGSHNDTGFWSFRHE